MNGHVPVARRIARTLPMLRILWGAIFASSIGLFAASRSLDFGAPASAPNATIGPMLFAVACLTGLFGVFLARSMLILGVKRNGPQPVVVQTPVILGLALTESVALFGLMLKAMGVSGGYGLPLFGISWLLFLARFPTLARPLGVLGPALDLTEPEGESDALR